MAVNFGSAESTSAPERSALAPESVTLEAWVNRELFRRRRRNRCFPLPTLGQNDFPRYDGASPKTQ